MSPFALDVGFMAGLIAMGHLVAGLFFLRFWRRTRDGLFLVFAFAFWLLGLNQALVGLSGAPPEDQGYFYLLRLAGFVLIIAAVLRKNLQGRGDQ
jgi:hypothetical protein